MTKLKTILLGGGTGFIGTHLSRLLKKNGYGVKVVSRFSGPLNVSWKDISNQGIPDDIYGVINVAGANVLDPKKRWNDEFKNEVYKSRVDTNTILAEAIVKAPIKPNVFISISGVGIYKPDQNIEYNELTEVKGYDFLSDLCIKWEQAAQISQSSCRHVNIRSGVVLARNGGMIQQLYIPFYMGLGGPVMPGTQYMPWIHMGDLCSLFIFCLENNVNGVLNGVSPQIISNKEFSEAFATALGRPGIIPVPEFVMNLMFGKERASMITKGQKVVPKRVLEQGFQYKFPHISNALIDIVKNPEN